MKLKYSNFAEEVFVQVAKARKIFKLCKILDGSKRRLLRLRDMPFDAAADLIILIVIPYPEITVGLLLLALAMLEGEAKAGRKRLYMLLTVQSQECSF